MADLGITACVQPAFVPSDAAWLPTRVGEARAALTYRFATLLAAGIPTCGGSDAPVEPPDPRAGMAAARDRAGFHLEESLTAEQALALFTTSAARSLGEPAPLAPGSPADFVVLDRDPVLVSAEELRRTRVLETWVAGQPAFQSSSRPSIPPATTTT
jgi:predicted amidohydrolase YtcJ